MEEQNENVYEEEASVSVPITSLDIRLSEADTFDRKIVNNTRRIKRRFLVKTGNKLFSIPCDRIAYFFIEMRCVFLKTKTDERFAIDMSMDELEEILCPFSFFRVRRSLMISFESIEALRYYSGGKISIKLAPPSGNEIFVSKERAAAFRQWLDM